VVLEPWRVGINGSTLTIPEGYRFDMASVPRILWPLLPSFALGTAAPLIHDYCYARAGHIDSWPPLVWKRAKVDALFRATMRDEGVATWKRTVAWLAVRAFGWLCWRKAEDHIVGTGGPWVGPQGLFVRYAFSRLPVLGDGPQPPAS
jgi:hypothetical protein